MRSWIIIALLPVGTAYADPDPQPPTVTVTTTTGLPQGPFLTLQPMPMFADPLPVTSVPSLRIDAARIAAEVFENSWRYPDTEPMFAFEGGHWFIGHGHYRPGSSRASALHGASMATTFVGEILLAAGSPLAGVAAMVTGATLDAAAADADRDAEARRPRK